MPPSPNDQSLRVLRGLLERRHAHGWPDAPALSKPVEGRTIVDAIVHLVAGGYEARISSESCPDQVLITPAPNVPHIASARNGHRTIAKGPAPLSAWRSERKWKTVSQQEMADTHARGGPHAEQDADIHGVSKPSIEAAGLQPRCWQPAAIDPGLHLLDA